MWRTFGAHRNRSHVCPNVLRPIIHANDLMSKPTARIPCNQNVSSDSLAPTLKIRPTTICRHLALVIRQNTLFENTHAIILFAECVFVKHADNITFFLEQSTENWNRQLGTMSLALSPTTIGGTCHSMIDSDEHSAVSVRPATPIIDNRHALNIRNTVK